METLYENLKELHDRELFLTEDDSKQLMELIVRREKDNPSEENPIPFSGGNNFTLILYNYFFYPVNKIFTIKS